MKKWFMLFSFVGAIGSVGMAAVIATKITQYLPSHGSRSLASGVPVHSSAGLLEPGKVIATQKVKNFDGDVTVKNMETISGPVTQIVDTTRKVVCYSRIVNEQSSMNCLKYE